MVGQLVGPRLHLGVGPPLAVGDQVLPLGVGVDGRLEQVGEVELHRSQIRTRSCSGAIGPAGQGSHRPGGLSARRLGDSAEAQSKRSGSLREISSQSGWNENQPRVGRGRVVPRVPRSLVVDEHRGAGRLGQELGLAGTLHGDEPPGGLVDRVPDGEQSVVAVDGGLVRTERSRQSLGGGLLQHDGTTAFLAHGVVLVEDAGVLRDRIERSPERRPCLAVDRVGVGGRHDVGPRRVHGGVDGEGGRVDRAVALDDLSGVADEDEVGDPHVAEAHAERVHPEVVGQLGIACRDVPGDALGEAEAAEQAQRAGQLLLAVQALLLHGGELRRDRHLSLRGATWLVPALASERACAIPPNYRLPMAYPTAATRDIAAPAEKVWILVTDLPRMGEWSPENAGGKWVKGATGPALGAVFKGTNRNGSPALVHHRDGRRLRAAQGVRVRGDVGSAGRGQLALRVRGDRQRLSGHRVVGRPAQAVVRHRGSGHGRPQRRARRSRRWRRRWPTWPPPSSSRPRSQHTGLRPAAAAARARPPPRRPAHPVPAAAPPRPGGAPRRRCRRT